MPILTMETPANMETTQKEIQEERSKDPAEESLEREFLKDLYIFMKKRDTPIERIPNLGFKQVDLYLMYKTVRELGGYHQVTAQQMWKQVYNMLGGNPRSTSAATCTRRHYEKLLLPYECHKKGISITLLPQHQPKPFPFASFCKEDGDGQRPSKRRFLSIPGTHNLDSDPHGRIFPMPHHYQPYFRPGLTVQAPRVPISSPVLTPQTPPAPQPWISFHPSPPNPTERAKQPLERLRLLADQYKTSSGLSGPLDLTVKSSRKETNASPVSSFTPPSSSKNPKFLNKPSTLYTPQSPQARKEGCDSSQDGDVGLDNDPYSFALKEMETYVVDVKAIKTSSSPRSVPTPKASEDTATGGQKPRSPQTAFEIRPKEEGQRFPDVRGHNLSHILPTLAKENGGRMEIEIPISVLHNWLRMCGSTATIQGLKHLTSPPLLEEQSHHPDIDMQPENLTYHTNTQRQSPAAEDLRTRKRSLPSPTAPTLLTPSPPLTTSPNPFNGFKLLPPGGILKNAASQDVCPFDQQDFQRPYTSTSPNRWGTFDKDTPIHMRTDSHIPVQQGSKSSDDDVILVEKDRETAPSAFLMLGPGSAPLLQLTNEEVMKLKRIISSS